MLLLSVLISGILACVFVPGVWAFANRHHFSVFICLMIITAYACFFSALRERKK
jgi:hypothetical protein